MSQDSKIQCCSLARGNDGKMSLNQSYFVDETFTMQQGHQSHAMHALVTPHDKHLSRTTLMLVGCRARIPYKKGSLPCFSIYLEIKQSLLYSF